MHLGAMLFAMAICATSLTELARFHWLVYLWEHRDSKVKPCTISSKHSLVFFVMAMPTPMKEIETMPSGLLVDEFNGTHCFTSYKIKAV